MRRNIILCMLFCIFVFSGCSAVSKDKKTSPDTQQNITNESLKDMKINDVTIEKSDDNNIKVTVDAEGENLKYAYYIYEGDKLMEKIRYGKDDHISYEVKNPGTYKVRVFVMNKDKEKVTKYTNEIEI
ncbi:triple tyrosine motif-containing protein [Lederbergia citrea]|uniref:Two component regulator three Y domain-containing protein n=1 Tax=Lederbergia citrea TaxID=2833581 RepID=A0A942UP08_9BACI|nr:triple tyrosine motif-containing protein [Lederbergia citrea]MBS4223372.1 hypothetical protein [Lederbergia citrea]